MMQTCAPSPFKMALTEHIWKLILLLIFLSSCSTAYDDDLFCYVQQSPCTCLTRNGKHIDLSPLSTGEKPRFTFSLESHTYEWDPCRTFFCHDTSAASACRKDRSYYAYPIGLQRSAKFLMDDRGMFLQYNGPNIWTVTKVYLKCNPDASEPHFSARGQVHRVQGETYEMTLEAKEVCPLSTPDPEGGDEDQDYRDPGDILLLLFVMTMLLYLILGAVFFIARSRRNEAIVHGEMQGTRA